MRFSVLLLFGEHHDRGRRVVLKVRKSPTFERGVIRKRQNCLPPEVLHNDGLRKDGIINKKWSWILLYRSYRTTQHHLFIPSQSGMFPHRGWSTWWWLYSVTFPRERMAFPRCQMPSWAKTKPLRQWRIQVKCVIKHSSKNKIIISVCEVLLDLGSEGWHQWEQSYIQ